MSGDLLKRKAIEMLERAVEIGLAADPADRELVRIGYDAAVALLDDRLDFPEAAAEEAEGGQEITAQLLRTDRVSLEVGPGLASLADPDEDGDLLDRLKHVRRKLVTEFGVIPPGVRVRPSRFLADGSYQVRIHGDLVAEGEVVLGSVLTRIGDPAALGLDLPVVRDPTHGGPAVWLSPENEAAARSRVPDLPTHDPQGVVSSHLHEVVKAHLDELLTREEVAELLNMARQDSPMVVQELVPNMLTLGQIRQVLQRLLREQIPIKNLELILNALADQSIYTKDSSQLAEHVRAVLGRKICQRYQSSDGRLHAFQLSHLAERTIQGSIQLDETGQVLRLQPDQSQSLYKNLTAAIELHRDESRELIIVCPPKIRRFVKTLFEHHFPELVVLGYSEVQGVEVRTLASLEIEDPGPPATPPPLDGDADDVMNMRW